MKPAQRKVHLLVWFVLGPVALAGLLIALALKPAEPVQVGPLPGVEVPMDDEAQDEPGESR